MTTAGRRAGDGMSATDMPAFVDWRIAVCPVHELAFNGEEAECPDCADERMIRELGPLPPNRRAKRLQFICPFCGSHSTRRESCSRYRCGRQSGLYPRAVLNRCAQCGHRTKYPVFCTRYECRKVAGTKYMYLRR